jgi:hypothetical protein
VARVGLGLAERPVDVPHATRLFAYISYAFRRSLKFILSLYHNDLRPLWCRSLSPPLSKGHLRFGSGIDKG